MSFEDAESPLLGVLSEANCSTSTRSVPLEQEGFEENEKKSHTTIRNLVKYK